MRVNTFLATNNMGEFPLNGHQLILAQRGRWAFHQLLKELYHLEHCVIVIVPRNSI